MAWYRMIRVALRLAGPDVLRPWRSPLLRWRIETFGFLDASGAPLDAEQLTPGLCMRFLVREVRALVRFLRWAAQL